MIFWTIIP